MEGREEKGNPRERKKKKKKKKKKKTRKTRRKNESFGLILKKIEFICDMSIV